jgi:exodeoxyribonuclease V gamma subunit
MLNLHFSNRFETLADQLVRRLGPPAGGRSPFEPDEIIVPSAAITRRLIIELARAQGICANVRFSYLAGWLWQHTAQLMPELPASARFDADVFAWRILAAFDDAAWSAAQPRLADWLGQADPVMRHELAVRVAGLFDDYLTYRPEWLEAWFRGEVVALPGADPGAALDQQWQAALWRRLAAETASDGRHPILALLELLDARGIRLAGTGRLPASAHVFCLPTLPPVHLELLRRLGAHIDLHVYVLNPSQEFWFDVVEPRRLASLGARGQAQYAHEGNRLLAAWGQQARSALGLLVDAASDGIVDDAQFVPVDATTLLGALQQAVLDATEPAPGSLAALAGDRSVEVHVCHSLTRELEVLHDRLLGLMAGPQPPQPGDILVVTPDLDAAAPLIDAVFGTAPRERHLPYAITGRARAQVNAPARALLDVLALAASRFAVNDVFGLLQQPVVARRFGLAEDDLDQVRAWLVQAGIHWALDAAHRGSFDVPPQPRHSFADGLDRLFLGYALPSHLQTPFQGRLPAGDAEGAGALVLGVFWRFVEGLKSLRERVAAPRRSADWPALLADALRDFVAPGDADLEDLREVDEAIARLAQQWRDSGLRQPLALDVVRAALEAALDDPARGGVPTGMITFAAMSSLRNVPFRVVCALGLDDGAFPTSARPAEFDLMALAPRRGDRQRRVDERNVFLDLLLAARERVHLSYAGRSVRDNAVRPASVLVAELLESLLPALTPVPASAATRAQARAALVIEHPLQPFAAAAFDVAAADPRVRSYQAEYAEALRQSLAAPAAAAVPVAALDDDTESDDDDLAATSATPFLVGRLAPADADWLDVPIARLARFFSNPCRFLLEQRLGLALRRDDEELQDDEPFVPDNSGRAPLTRLLLPALLAGMPPEAARTLALAGTAVPAGGFGRRFLERELDGLRDFAAQVREHTLQPVLPPHAAALTLHIDGQAWRLHGELGELRPRGLLHYRYARQGVHDYLDSWLPHLLMCASAPPGMLPVTTGIARDGRFFLNECVEPVAALETLVRLYAQGLREPLAFFPRAAWEWISGDQQGPAKAIAAFRPGGFNEVAEGRDAAYRLALRGRPDPFAPEVVAAFYANAHAVLDPLRACLERE